MDRQDQTHEKRIAQSHAPSLSRRERFFASYYWLILKNVIGWVLIVLAFVAGPVVPGPGGIPLFLIGFALVSFPGKRRLTARVLRGKPFQFPPALFALICTAVALAAPALVMLFARSWPRWLAQRRNDALAQGPVATVTLSLVIAGITWALVRTTPHALNLLTRIVARARRRFRPWLRHHHVRLLPPRWRRRHPHEPGSGPFRLKDEILKFTRKGRIRD